MPFVRLAISKNRQPQRPSRREITKKILERIAELTAQEKTYDRSSHDGAYLSALATARIEELHWVMRCY